ncbi:leucyl-tRNA synthetase-like protein [Trichodelitschia bisporula]|uniref:leucine--tRNA ligase n=1 Tax=Trichodelitschia bisporula TaxID=703511 RepID=A0A6G1I9R1_9PEZI|nr:leucyl-tRNA synthetase-like protein [Trichodelitschia bisporula]
MSASKSAAEPVDPTSNTQGTLKIENTEKRDTLKEIEKRYQKQWQDSKIFEADAPSIAEYPPEKISPEDLRAKEPKFFGTMAYPYVNGTPHLGHGFTVTKIEYASRVARHQGKRVLYPQGYHCTGMPIKACADKLIREVELFGKNFENYKEEDVEEAPIPAPTQAETKTDMSKFTNLKKGKAAMKTVKTKYQFQVMLALGIPVTEIHKFADPNYWCEFFPSRWQGHLIGFGSSVDWRRSFVTTDLNPYYDSFVRWQMRRLKELGKIDFGKRYTVYSPRDGQPCLDHDRASGEGVLVQEYTGIKCKVEKWSEEAEKQLAGKLTEGASVYMVPATLRPETMLGQTNLFVSPKITYGVYQVSDKEYYFVTERAARNMAFQGIFPSWGSFPKVADIKGSDAIGTLVQAPLSRQGSVYVVPMDTIKETKGTGVVTSVPSDSPDDYIMTVDLAKKAEFYKIKPEWVSLDILPIIETPSYGNLTAPALVKKLKINSPKDAKQLAEAKELAYKEGFYQGKMIFGEFEGRTVQDAKGLIRQRLIDSGDALVYCEPDGLVMSRSGDECVAAHMDQWFLTYGNADEEWRGDVLGHVRNEDGQNFNSFTPETKHALEQTLGWMNQWAVTRQFGLGTRLPWDPSQLVESLSDSTIYMAYYTIAHYLHSDIYGRKPGIGNIKPEQMKDEVWEYIFALRDSVDSDIPKETLAAMKREFTYWYPLDVRVSGKDLINNHLIFFLYIHQAIWGKKAPQYLPKGIRLNGHAMLNGEKMSKSTGNFLTLDDAVAKFGADATRIALADSGDGVEDANFEEAVANSTILKLFELKKWIEEEILEPRLLKEGETYAGVRDAEKIKTSDIIQRTGPKNFWDQLFENELNTLVKETVQHYSATLYKAALKSGFYDFTSARDSYRISTTSASVGMHHDCVKRYAELQALMLAVVAPHWSDYIWQEVLKKPSTIQTAVFPSVPDSVPSLTAASEYIRSTHGSIGTAEGVQQKKLAKGKTTSYDPKSDKKLTIFVAKSWPAWQQKYLNVVRELFDGLTLDIKKVQPKIEKPDMKKAMPFVQGLKRRLESGEKKEAVFERELGFDEVLVLLEMIPGLLAIVPKLKVVEVVIVDDGAKEGVKIEADGKAGEKVTSLPPAAAGAEPGVPTFEFSNI